MDVVTGPVARFARQIAGNVYIVAAPSSYHEFTSYEPLAYDGAGTDTGNEYKVKKVRLPISRTPSDTDIWANGRMSDGRSYMPTMKTLHCLSPRYSTSQPAMGEWELQECALGDI